MSARHEWRVTWRRADWSPTTWPKSKTFGTEASARRFIADRLQGDRRPELAPLVVCRLTMREVGEWQEVASREAPPLTGK